MRPQAGPPGTPPPGQLRSSARTARPRPVLRAPLRRPPDPGEQAAGLEEAHRCRGFQARWAEPCGSSRTSRRRGGAGRRRPVASSRGSGPCAPGPGEPAGAAANLSWPALPLTAGLGLRPEPAPSDPATVGTPPRPAQHALRHCGARMGGAAGLIQPIGCSTLDPGPRRPGPAQDPPPLGNFPAITRPRPLRPAHVLSSSPTPAARRVPAAGPPRPNLAPPRAPGPAFPVQS